MVAPLPFLKLIIFPSRNLLYTYNPHAESNKIDILQVPVLGTPKSDTIKEKT